MRLLDITKKVDDFLGNLPPKQFKQIYSKIMTLRKNTLPNDSIKLHGFKDKYRADIGEYRIVYSFDDKIVYIQAIGKRNNDDIYKKIKK
jgi:mRNA interferase RelE/StbE